MSPRGRSGTSGWRRFSGDTLIASEPICRKIASLRASSRKRGQGRVLFFGEDSGEQALALDLHDVGHFRRQHVIGAAALRLADQPRRPPRDWRRDRARAHLHQADPESGDSAALMPARLGSPAANRACRHRRAHKDRRSRRHGSSPMKICGQRLRPLARVRSCARAGPRIAVTSNLVEGHAFAG